MSTDPRRLTLGRHAVFLLGIAVVIAMTAALLPQLRDGLPYTLPTTASLEGSYDRSGFQYASHSYCYHVTDDQLLDLLIDRWKLARISDADQRAISYTTHDPPSWWPSDRTLRKFPEQYEHEERGRYWSVWVDRENCRLWAEFGKL
jgi:hypothetical protein